MSVIRIKKVNVPSRKAARVAKQKVYNTNKYLAVKKYQSVRSIMTQNGLKGVEGL